MKNLVGDLLDKEMDRKQFFQFMGGAALVLTGVVGFMKSLRGLRTGEGYGGSYFGKSEDTMDKLLSSRVKK